MSGHAFPTEEWFNEQRIGQWPGMTLRDYFAAAALTGELAAHVNSAITHEEAARSAYATADAMLLERHKHFDQRRATPKRSGKRS